MGRTEAINFDRRIRRQDISAVALIGLLSMDGTKKLHMTGMPADACIWNISYDPLRNVVTLYIYSESFEMVAEGAEAPMMDIQVRDVTDRLASTQGI